jgi:hypothetical protein
MKRRRPLPDFNSIDPMWGTIQIVFLTGLLIGVLYFRNEIGKATGDFLNFWGASDLQVETAGESGDTGNSGDSGGSSGIDAAE